MENIVNLYHTELSNMSITTQESVKKPEQVTNTKPRSNNRPAPKSVNKAVEKGIKESTGKIKLRLESYDSTILSVTMKNICSTVQNAGGQIKSLVRLPNKYMKITVNKAPHIDKKSRDQFKLTAHRVFLQILPNEQTKEALARMQVPANILISLS